MMSSEIPNFQQAKDYFEERLNVHGATARGVDWNSEASQEIRFSQLAKVCSPNQPFSLLDYGCGYGALAAYILRQQLPMQAYVGYDVLESMVLKARETYAGCHWRALPTGQMISLRLTTALPVAFSISS
jgi:SAM-dependent methyltransferase